MSYTLILSPRCLNSTFQVPMARKGSRITSVASYLRVIRSPSPEDESPETNTKETVEPPQKKRKRDYVKLSPTRYKVNGLVPQYTDESQVPEHLKKCEPYLPF